MAGDNIPAAEGQAKEKADGQKNGRRCLITRESEPAETLVRLALGPEETLVPDVAAKLPGRGVWIVPDKALIEKAITSGQLLREASRSLKTGLKRDAVPPTLADDIDRLLSRRILDRMGLEQKAGHLVTGFDKIKAALTGGKMKPGFLFSATDGAEDGRRKMQAALGHSIPEIALFDREALGHSIPEIALFDREALSKALGRDNVVHVLLMKSGGTLKLMADISRLLRLRGISLQPEAQGNAE